MRRVGLLLMLMALALFVVPRASATTYTLTDLNSTLAVDDGSSFGAYNWTIDGADILYQQWFWYRVGSTSGEHSVDSLTLSSANMTDPRSLDLTYSGSGFQVEVSYQLHGGTAGSRTSDVAEVIHITNTGSSPLDFHFFQYSDFDIGYDRIDQVTIDPTRQVVDQAPVIGGPGILTETVLTPRPNRAEANYYANTLASLMDGSPTNLNNVLTAGPGDVTWAFQWDKVIAPHGSFLISKDKNAQPVPEPATIALLGGVLVLLARRFRPAGV